MWCVLFGFVGIERARVYTNVRIQVEKSYEKTMKYEVLISLPCWG